jgi:hypothetical protein
MSRLFIIIIIVYLSSFSLISSQTTSRNGRKTKEMEERINNLDEGTKKRIGAMKASGDCKIYYIYFLINK